jgi:hypothetical protein
MPRSISCWTASCACTAGTAAQPGACQGDCTFAVASAGAVRARLLRLSRPIRIDATPHHVQAIQAEVAYRAAKPDPTGRLGSPGRGGATLTAGLRAPPAASLPPLVGAVVPAYPSAHAPAAAGLPGLAARVGISERAAGSPGTVTVPASPPHDASKPAHPAPRQAAAAPALLLRTRRAPPVLGKPRTPRPHASCAGERARPRSASPPAVHRLPGAASAAAAEARKRRAEASPPARRAEAAAARPTGPVRVAFGRRVEQPLPPPSAAAPRWARARQTKTKTKALSYVASERASV